MGKEIQSRTQNQISSSTVFVGKRKLQASTSLSIFTSFPVAGKLFRDSERWALHEQLF